MSAGSLIISGVVRGPDGAPVAGARVYFVDSPAALPDIAALTDAGGRFRLAVPVPGIYRLESSLNGCDFQAGDGIRVEFA